MYTYMNDRTISIKDFVAMSGMCKTTTHKLINLGRLQSTKVGNRRLISLRSAQALISPSIGMEGGQ